MVSSYITVFFEFLDGRSDPCRVQTPQASARRLWPLTHPSLNESTTNLKLISHKWKKLMLDLLDIAHIPWLLLSRIGCWSFLQLRCFLPDMLVVLPRPTGPPLSFIFPLCSFTHSMLLPPFCIFLSMGWLVAKRAWKLFHKGTPGGMILNYFSEATQCKK